MGSAAASALETAMSALARARVLVVALDFDGTLAPFVDRPENARALPESARAVHDLAGRERTHVVLVSGRPLDSLAALADAPAAAILIGSHGAQWSIGGVEQPVSLDDSDRERLEALGASLEALAARHPGAFVERKPLGLALHTRRADRRQESAILDEASRLAAATAGPALLERDGKHLVEFALSEVTKGDALRRVRRQLGDCVMLFAGDDVTDEDGFAVLAPGDVGIKVGPGPTRAEHRLDDPQSLAAVLTTLARDRASVVA